MQLAIYRLAWARLMDVPVEQVSAAFVIVGTGEVLRPDTEPTPSPVLRRPVECRCGPSRLRPGRKAHSTRRR